MIVLAIGFDDCIGKPINLIDLKKTILKFKNTHLFNTTYYDDSYSDNLDLYHRLVSKSKEEFEKDHDRLTQMTESFDLEDDALKEFEELSHKIKGYSATICFESVRCIAYNLEHITANKYIKRDKDLDIIRNLIGLLKIQFDKSIEYCQLPPTKVGGL